MRNKILLLPLAAFFAGCSMMPYHDDFMCQGGSNIHICKSVSDVYQESDEINKPENQKQQIYSYYEDTNLSKENRELKNIIEAISLEKLEKPVSVNVNVKTECNNKNKQNKNQDDKLIKINKEVKVCVLNANIRELPSCKAPVVGIAHKGEKLFAYYLKGAWVKVKNGYIHKSLVCGECGK